jgi:hypothetical protein
MATSNEFCGTEQSSQNAIQAENVGHPPSKGEDNKTKSEGLFLVGLVALIMLIPVLFCWTLVIGFFCAISSIR